MPTVPFTRSALLEQAKGGIDLLNRRFWSPSVSIWFEHQGDDPRAFFEGRHRPTWWPSANAVETLIDYGEVSGTTFFQAEIGRLYELQKDADAKMTSVVEELKRRGQWTERDAQTMERRLDKKRAADATRAGQTTAPAAAYYTDFQNEYLDDSGWWGVTWLRQFDRTKLPRYLATAKAIQAHMARQWRPDKGGGILWCEHEDKQHPNAITNNLFLILSARLYERTQQPGYLVDAEKTLRWIHEQALYDGTGVVDQPGHQGDYWSYNQGAFIGGLCALAHATGQPEPLEEAARVAENVLHRAGFTTPSGVLVEKLGTDGDASLFKGILLRYLVQLHELLRARALHPELAREIEHVVQASVLSLQAHGVAADGLFQADWQESGKDSRGTFNSQLSGIAALVGAAALAH